MSVSQHTAHVESLGVLSTFRHELHTCFTARGDALFELTDALLCTEGPVRTLVDLCLAPEHRRGHGALYAGLNHGRIDTVGLRWSLAALPLPRTAHGRLVLAVDVSPWLRPDAATSPQRSFCHTYGRGADQHVMVPGWPYSVVAALESGPTSWTAVLDAVRLEPDADVAAVTARQLGELIQRLIQAGHHSPGDADIMVVADAGYDLPRLAHLLADLPVQILGRMRSDRVLYRPAPERVAGTWGRPPRHGAGFAFAESSTWAESDQATSTHTDRYGAVTAQAWDRLHPLLTRRCAWLGHTEPLPIIEGTVIRLQVERLPSGGVNKPVWLWTSATGVTGAEVDRCWQMFLRRFDIEHTFRLFKQVLGWCAPKLRSPEAADRWSWLVIAAYTQLRLARAMAADLRRPWERAVTPQRRTPARVRRGFRYLRAKVASPACAPKPCRPGPGRPPGTRNKHRAPVQPVGKQDKTPTTGEGRKKQAR